MDDLKTLLAKARAEMGEKLFQEFCDDLAGRRKYKCPETQDGDVVSEESRANTIPKEDKS